MNWQSCKAVDRNPAKLGGVWCFAGTRLEWFPEVTPDQVHEVLAFAKESLRVPAAVA